jgi:acyl carrier protein
MIPAYFVKMDKIPLTHNGKIDRKKLPEPEIGTAGESQTAPRNKIQEILRDIWSEVLGLESGIIGIDANFFELGGHSIKATIMTARAHKELNVKIPLSEVFMTPTIRGLAEYIKSTSKTQFVAIRPVEKKECYPLSSAQKRLYQIHLMDSESLSYNVSSLLLLEGKLNIDKFEDIFQQLIRRHESFRTSFRLMNGSLVQWVKEDVFFQIQRFSREESRLERHAIMRFIRPFDLSQAPLLRIGIAPLQENKYLLLVDMHHIISDHISTQIIIKDITALYLGEKLPRLKLQYKDYSQWQESSHQSPEMKRQEEYWLKVFAGNIPVLDIATDYPRPSVRRFEGDHLVFFIENPLYAQLERLIRETGVTLYMFLLALCNILLWKYANQEDIIIGSPIMGRRHKDLEDIIGVFIGQLPMRNYPSGGKTFREFLAEVKQNALDAYENQEYPFEELTRQLGLQGNPARHPLFDVVFAIFNKSELAGKDGYLMELGDLRLSPYPFEDKTAKTDLRFEAAETGNRIRMTLTYSTALFKRSSAENITRRFMEILSHVVENSHIKLADIAVSHTRSMAKSTVHEDSAGDFGF